MRDALVCLAVMTACYSPIVPTGVACPDGVTCPNGQMCIAGFCGGTPPIVDGDPGDDTIIIPDDGSVDGPPIDAPPMTMGWATPIKIVPLSGPGDDFAPSISANGLSLHLNTNGTSNGDFKIYISTRASVTAAFGPLIAVQGPDISDIEYDADISLDELELYFISDLAPAGVRRVSRLATNQPWSGPQLIGLDGKQGPNLFANDLRMLVSTNTIQEYSRPDLNTPIWSFVRNHSNLNSHGYPGISADGLELYTTRSGNIYRSTRTGLDQPFGMPSEVTFGPPFDGYSLVDPELSQDGNTLYLSINANTSAGYDIYVTTR